MSNTKDNITITKAEYDALTEKAERLDNYLDTARAHDYERVLMRTMIYSRDQFRDHDGSKQVRSFYEKQRELLDSYLLLSGKGLA